MPSGHAGFRPPSTYLEGATTKILDILSGGGKVLDYLGGPCTFGGDPSLRAIIWGLTLTVLDRLSSLVKVEIFACGGLFLNRFSITPKFSPTASFLLYVPHFDIIDRHMM